MTKCIMKCVASLNPVNSIRRKLFSSNEEQDFGGVMIGFLLMHVLCHSYLVTVSASHVEVGQVLF